MKRDQQLIERFWALRRRMRFTSTETVLYLCLVRLSRQAEWPAALCCSNAELCREAQIDESTLVRVRRALVGKGVVRYAGRAAGTLTTCYVLPSLSDLDVRSAKCLDGGGQNPGANNPAPDPKRREVEACTPVASGYRGDTADACGMRVRTSGRPRRGKGAGEEGDYGGDRVGEREYPRGYGETVSASVAYRPAESGVGGAADGGAAACFAADVAAAIASEADGRGRGRWAGVGAVRKATAGGMPPEVLPDLLSAGLSEASRGVPPDLLPDVLPETPTGRLSGRSEDGRRGGRLPVGSRKAGGRLVVAETAAGQTVGGHGAVGQVDVTGGDGWPVRHPDDRSGARQPVHTLGLRSGIRAEESVTGHGATVIRPAGMPGPAVPAPAAGGNTPRPLKRRRVRVELDLSFVRCDYLAVFGEWLGYKRARGNGYRTQGSLEACYARLLALSGGDPAVAREVVRQSIANNWSGIFELRKNHAHQTDVPAYTGTVSRTAVPSHTDGYTDTL